jgi:hypothetical protein
VAATGMVATGRLSANGRPRSLKFDRLHKGETARVAGDDGALDCA